MAKFAERLAILARDFPSRKALAEKIGVSPSQVTDWINGRSRPTERTVERIAQKTGKTAAWLVGEEPWHPQRTIPILATASAAGPDGICVVAEGEERYHGSQAIPDLHAVRVRGDSMIPVALNGQLVLVDDQEPQSGDLAVVETEDHEVMFKRVEFAGDKVLCVPLNLDPRFRTIIVPRKSTRMRKVWGIKF